MKRENDVGTVFFDGPAAFRRLCVETVFAGTKRPYERNQPPSGGCVLKLF